MNQNNCKILWLSDIHFANGWKDCGYLSSIEKYLTTFLEKVLYEHQFSDPYRYIILSGDIANFGIGPDYQAFKERLLIPLMDGMLALQRNGISLPLILTVPGNHDLNWKEADFLHDYLKQVEGGVFSDDDTRSHFLGQRTEEFRELFHDYTQFIRDLTVDSKYGVFFRLSGRPHIEFCPLYDHHRLYGYVIDKLRNVIFVFLNSAWYSIGSHFNELFALQKLFSSKFSSSINEFEKWRQNENLHQAKGLALKDMNMSEAAKEGYQSLLHVLNLKDSISEYSQQIAGIQLMEYELLEQHLTNLNDYLVITVMHHPLNWLRWEEQYSTKKSPENSNGKLLKKLLDESDLFLTGHEHVPHDTPAQHMFDRTIHLKAGCFCFGDNHSKRGFSDYWFSILHIDSFNGRWSQSKYVYDETPGAENWHNLDPDRKSQYFSKKRVNPPLSVARREQISRYRHQWDLNLTKTYIKDKKLSKLQESVLAPYEPLSNENWDSYLATGKIKTEFGEEAGIELFIFARSPNFYQSFNGPTAYKIIDDLVQQMPCGYQAIKFIVLDIYIDDSVLALYNKYRLVKVEVYVEALRIADRLFDKFRHDYFIRLEVELISDGNLDMNVWKAKMALVRRLKYYNHVMSFFQLENMTETRQIEAAEAPN